MSEGPLWTVAGIGRHCRGFARGNLAALLSGQAVLTLVNVALLIMINRVYARPGDATDVGRLAAVLSLMTAVVLLAVSGIAVGLTRRISLARVAGGAERTMTIGRAIGGGITLAAVSGFAMMLLGLVAPPVVYAAAKAWWPEQAPKIEPYVGAIQLAALWLPGLSLGLVFSAVFDGFQRMRWSLLAEAGTFQVLRLAAAAAAMLVAGWAWTGLIGAWAGAYALAAVLMGLELWVLLSLERQPVAWRQLPLGGMVRDAVVMFLPTVAPMLFSQAGVLVAWVAVGDQGAATFWVTWSLAVAVTAICWPAGRVLLPAIPGLLRNADLKEVARVFRLAFWGASGVAFLFIAAVGAVKGWLLTCLNQEGQGAILTVLLAAGFFEAVRVVFNPVLLGSGAERSLALLEWVSLAVILIGGSAAAAIWGVPGLVAVFVAVFALSMAFRIRLLAQVTGVRLWREVALATAAVVGLTAVFIVVE